MWILPPNSLQSNKSWLDEVHTGEYKGILGVKDPSARGLSTTKSFEMGVFKQGLRNTLCVFIENSQNKPQIVPQWTVWEKN